MPDEELEAERAERGAAAERLREELHKIDTSFENIWKAIEAGVTPPGAKERIASLENHKSELEIELQKAEEDEGSTPTWEDYAQWLDGVGAESDPWYIIDMFVHKMVVIGDELHLCFAFDDAEDELPVESNENTRLKDGCSQDTMWRNGRGSNPRPPA